MKPAPVTRCLIAIALSVFLAACAPTKSLSPVDKAHVKDLAVSVAARFEHLTINCKGVGCAGILYGVRGDPNAPRALTSAYEKVGPPVFDLIREELSNELNARGIEVRTFERTPFITLPKAPELLSQTGKLQGSPLLHIQIWDFGISRTGSTQYQPTVLIRAYLVRREGSELLYSQAYEFGAAGGGLPIALGSTDTRFATIGHAQQSPERLAQGLRAGVRAIVRRIATDVSG